MIQFYDHNPWSAALVWTLLAGPPVLGLGGLLTGTVVELGRREIRGVVPFRAPVYSSICGAQWFAYIVSLFLFILALFEPGMRNDPGGRANPGWALLLIGFPYYGLNFWLLIAPIVIVWLQCAKIWWLQFIPLVVQCGCVFVAFNAAEFDAKYPGYALWVASYCGIAVAYAIPMGFGFRLIKQGPGRTDTVV